MRPNSITAFVASILIAIIPAIAQDDVEEVELQLTDEEVEMLAKLPGIPANQSRKPGEKAFAVISFGQPEEEFFYMRDGKPEKIHFNSGAIRRFQYGSFPGSIVFYRKPSDDEPQDKPIPIGKADIGSAEDGIIVFVAKRAEEKQEIQRMPFIDISKNTFAPGDVRLLNLTRLPILVNLAEKPEQISPMGSIVRSTPRKAQIFPLQIAFRDGEKTKMIYSNVFQVEKNMRVMYLIVPDRMNANASSPIRCMVYKDLGAVTK